MDPSTLGSLGESAWIYLAGPALAIAAVVLTVRMRGVQVRQIAAGARALRAGDPAAAGSATPTASTLLASAGSLGAAAAVGAATAVSLGGVGVIAWVWLFGLMIAPLRYVEVLLARTDSPGRTDAAESGSLARRLVREGGAWRPLGYALIVLVALTAFGFVGGVHGAAVQDAARQLLPDSGPALVGGVAIMAAILAVAGARHGAQVAGWLAAAALAVLFALAAWVCLSDPARAIGALARAAGETIDGAPPVTPFAGAFAGEVAMAAVLYLLPPLAAGSGIDGAIHAAARAKTTKGQAAAAMLGPLAYAVVTTALCVSFAATGAYYRRVEDSRPLAETKVYRVAFESASQRIEVERLYSGYMRVVDGEARDVGPIVATERGMVRAPRFEDGGEPADVALLFERGRLVRLLRNRNGVLREEPLESADRVDVVGTMLPRGGALLSRAAARGAGGTFGSRLLLGALLILAAAGAAAWSFSIAASLGPRAAPWARVAVGLLPSAGLGLAATSAAPWLHSAGLIVAAVTAAVVALVLVARAGQAARLAK